MTLQASANTQAKRIHWLDNLRTICILLVVLYHVGGVYEGAGLWGWFWIVDDPATLSWVGIVGIVFDIFMMPTVFLISGYLSAASLKTKTAGAFLKGKFNRLVIPWVVAVFTLIPIYKVIFLYSRNLPQEHWSTYFHITNPNSQNWLWFLPLLFVFNLLYMLLEKAGISFSKLSLKVAIPSAVVLGILYSFGIGTVVEFRSWTLTPLIDFENERVLAYFMAFLLGVICFKRETFAEKPQSKTLYTIMNSVAWLPVTFHIFVRLYPFFYPEGFSVTQLYRLLWWLSFYPSLLCMMYIMIESFWRYFDKTGSLWGELNKNSYGVYIIHVIVIGIFGTMLLRMDLAALLKYPLLFLSTYLVSNLLVSGYRSMVQVVRNNRRKPGFQSAD